MADNSRAKAGFDQLRKSGAGQILSEYLMERLAGKQEVFTTLNKDAFETHKGRCLELKDLINEILK